MKVWVTKYAFTGGVGVFEGQQVSKNEVKVFQKSAPNGSYLVFGNDWHLSEEAAKSRVEEMRKAEISSLKKQIDKLERYSFTCQEMD